MQHCQGLKKLVMFNEGMVIKLAGSNIRQYGTGRYLMKRTEYMN